VKQAGGETGRMLSASRVGDVYQNCVSFKVTGHPNTFWSDKTVCAVARAQHCPFVVQPRVA